MSELTRGLRECPRGQWKILRVDGALEVRVGKPTIGAICEAIDAATLDTVILRGTLECVVMMVDDAGAITKKPVNAGATRVYQAQCRPGTTHQIRGDVAIVNDNDFA